MYTRVRWALALTWKHRTILAALAGVLLLFVLQSLDKPGWRATRPSKAPHAAIKARPAPATPLVFTDLASLVLEKPAADRVSALFRLSESVERPATRGEFETEAEYQQRLGSPAQLIGKYRRDTQFAIVLSTTATYDMGKGRLRVTAAPSDGLALNDPESAPTVTLSTATLATRSYRGQNAFGVSREVTVQQEEKLVFIPIARIAAPPGCDFSKGAPEAASGATLVDAESMIRWACGLRYVETDKIENLATLTIPLSREEGRQARSGPLYLAYVVSFELPAELEAHAGPMTYSRDAPTLNSPIDRQVVGEALTARLKRVIVFSLNKRVWLDRSFD